MLTMAHAMSSLLVYVDIMISSSLVFVHFSRLQHYLHPEHRFVLASCHLYSLVAVSGV